MKLLGTNAISMHRLIMNTPDGMDTDHINRDKLDNRRENLRVCTTSQNTANSKKQSVNTSGFKGVFSIEGAKGNAKKWKSKIEVKGSSIYLGSFNTAQEAAKAYDNAAVKYFGEFAKLNFQKEQP